MAIPRLILRISPRVTSLTKLEPVSEPAAVTAFAPRSSAAKKAVGSIVARTLNTAWSISRSSRKYRPTKTLPYHQ